MCKINILDKLSFILVIIGALNWGFIGLLNFNLFTFITCSIPVISRILYILIALSGINLISLLFRSKLISLK